MYSSLFGKYIKQHLAHVDFELSERIPNLKTESVDLVIGMSVPIQEDAMQRAVRKTKYLYCASPSFIDKYPNIETKNIHEFPI